MKRLPLFILMLMATSLCRAQLVYSLDDDHAFIAAKEKQLKTLATDSARGYTHFKLSVWYKLVADTVATRQHLNAGLALSDKHPFLAAAKYYYIAHSLYASRNFERIESNLLKCDTLLGKLKLTEAFKIRGYVWHNYGTWQQVKGNEKTAMDAFVNKALPYAKASGDRFLIGNVKKAIAIVLMNADQRDKAASHLTEAIVAIKASAQDNPIRSETLAECYLTAAENYLYHHQPYAAGIMLSNARQIIIVQPRSNLYLNYYCTDGTLLSTLKRHGAAYQSFDKGIAMAQQAGAQQWINRLQYAKHKALLSAGKITEAITILTDLLDNSAVFVADRKLYFDDLHKAYVLLGDHKSAYKYAKAYIALSDSLYKAGYQSNIMELEGKYNAKAKQEQIMVLQAQKEKEALTASNQRLIIGLLAAGFVFLIILLFLGFKLNTGQKKFAQQKQQQLQEQIDHVKQQQQLKVAQALLQGEEKERKRLAGDLHDGLGGLLVGIKLGLSAQRNPIDPAPVNKQLNGAINEMRRIARNMMPAKLLHLGFEAALKDLCESVLTDKVKLSCQVIGLQTNIPQEIQVAMFRIVQELLANAIKHSGADMILVQCSQHDAKCYITVEDNGRGISLINTEHKGIGLINVKNRVEYLNGRMETITAAGRGTTINIEFDING